jgi:hypothetical protein|tara:strand:- start:419 stop:658 length:240 start_codon:yes stop_codon:yes gene_type:complete
MIGTSKLPFVDINDYPRINDINSLSSLPDPGYPLKIDSRKGKRLLSISKESQIKRELNQVGLSIPDGRWPKYTQLSDSI